MKRQEFARILNVASAYDRKPSEILCIEDEYTAFCLDEAAAYIRARMKEGLQPEFELDSHAHSLSEFYERIGAE